MTEGNPGIERPAVDGWLEANCGLSGPFDFELIEGGRSNLTYRVHTGDGTTVVLRRPPTGSVLPSAHDMAREHRIIAALHGSAVPVARPFGFCGDPAVTGAPFYVMEQMPGHVIRDVDTAAELSAAVRATAVRSLVGVMVRLHAIDPDSVGLGDLGRPDGYVSRQLRRWHGQSQQSRSRDLSHVDDVHERLVAAIPDQQRTSITHGDYRLDNAMFDDTGVVIAVFDWEICTLGDPLADLGLLVTYWSQADDAFTALPGAPTTLPGFPGRDEVIEHYRAESDLSLEELPFYVAFGHWKLACILDGVAARYRAGVMAGEADVEGYDEIVDLAAVRARELLDGAAI